VNIEDSQFQVGVKIDVKHMGKNEKGQIRLSRRIVLHRDNPFLSLH
jgi:hypothetical protein